MVSTSRGGLAPPAARALVRLPAVHLLVLLGSFLLTVGAAEGTQRLVLAGAIFLGLGLLLFWDEGRWSRGLIRPGPASPARASGAPAWWKRPISFRGRWLCTTCGWRQEERTTLCPRCGKPMVLLPTASGARAPEVKT